MEGGLCQRIESDGSSGESDAWSLRTLAITSRSFRRPLKERGANDIRLVSLIAAPEGVERMRGIHPDVPIWLAAIDEGLDENAYILPGLGDAGDRAYGTR